jgi:hypothetical protein
MSKEYLYEQCIIDVGAKLKKRGTKRPEEKASNMCKMWLEEIEITEKTFAGNAGSLKEKRKQFAVSFEGTELTDAEDYVEFPVIALTSGLHTYDDEGIEQKVYIEPTVLKEYIESFKELPIYYTHQRTPEDLLGLATSPELIELDNGKTAIKMLAKINKSSDRAEEVLKKVDEGDITHVSVDWFSNDLNVMGEPFASTIRPVELSFIDNEIATPVCDECTIDGETCNEEPEDVQSDGELNEVKTMTDKKVEVKSEADGIVEREFASLRTQLDEVTESHTELQTKYDEALKSIKNFTKANEERDAAEATERKSELVSTIINKELLLNTLTEDNKNGRTTELSEWDELKLNGFFSALDSIPEPAEMERTFGKGKSHDSEDAPVEGEQEVERLFAMKDGKIVLNKEALKGD